MRKRESWVTGAVEPFTVTTWHGPSAGGTPGYSTKSTIVSAESILSQYKQIDDVVTPYFAQRVKRGELIMNPMAIQRATRGACIISFKAGPWPTWYNGGYELYEGDISSYFSTIPSLTVIHDDDHNRRGEVALIKAYAKMNDSVLMGGELAATLNQTIGMLRRPFHGAIDLCAKMHKYRAKRLGKTARSATKATADAWLEYRYGWKPLIGDTQSIIDASHKLVAQVGKRRLTARASEEIKFELSDPFEMPIYPPLKAVGVRTARGHEQAHAGVIYEAKPQTKVQQLTAMLGLRPQDVPATLWELTPWSFVVDWFVNVGPWLRAVTPNPEVTVLGNWVTYVSRRTMTYSGMLTYTWNGTFTYPMPGMSNGYDFVERKVNQPLTTTPVLIKKPLSILHMADAMGLLLGKVLTGLNPFKH